MTGELPGPKLTAPRKADVGTLDPASATVRWFWSRPLLIVLLAHSLFSIGIWNAQDGFDEDAYNVVNAYRLIQADEWSPSLYLNLLAGILQYVTADPLAALTILKYIASLLATVALWLTLRVFIGRLELGSLLVSCSVWIACAFHAPFIQSTSLSLFAFATMLLGVVCVLQRWSPARFAGFCVLGAMATTMRSEYALPLVLIALLITGYASWRWIQSLDKGVQPYLFGGTLLAGIATLSALWAFPPSAIKHKLAAMDYHALLGLGQCYAGFYQRRHPQEIFNPATEYQAVLDRVFDHPQGFSDAARNNPRELTLYLSLNTARNLFTNLPKRLLGSYRAQSEKARGWLYWAVRVGLLAGVIAAAIRWKKSNLLKAKGTNSFTLPLLLLTLLASAALPAIILLIGLGRYYLPCVPLYFVGVAFCVDSLIKALKSERFQGFIVAGCVLFLCWPNYLAPRPNLEVNVVRQVAPMVKARPVVAAWWADPGVILGLRGEGTSLGLVNGIKAADITGGRIDILMIDNNFRSSRTWVEQSTFFESFERDPPQFGFRKLTGVATGRFDVYYRPVAPPDRGGP